MRRLAPLLASLVVLALAAPPVPAQDAIEAGLLLVRQSPWVSRKRPVVDVQVRVQNGGDATLDDLSLGVTLFTPARSRSAYRDSLTGDTGVIERFKVVRLDESVQPDADRVVGLRWNLSFLKPRYPQSLIFPLKVELRSGDTAIDVIRTPVVFLEEKPRTPLALAWTFVLHERILYEPSGVFRDATLERRLAPGGPLSTAIEVLEAFATSGRAEAVDVALSPTLLDQLERMRGGYAVRTEAGAIRAVARGQGGSATSTRALALLRSLLDARSVETSALPYSAPNLPALIGSDLSRDLPVQLRRGRELVVRLVGADPEPSVLRPPGSALDGHSLAALADQGVRTLLLNSEAVPLPPGPLGFAPPPIASLSTGGRPDVAAVVQEPGLEELLGSSLPRDDPRLAAHLLLGELAAIWLERPAEERGVAILVEPGQSLPAGFFAPLVQGVADAPWVNPTRATTLAEDFPSRREPARLAPADIDTFSRDYLAAVKHARRQINAYRSTLLEPNPLVARLQTDVLVAESGEFLALDREGREFLQHVEDTVAAQFAKVQPDISQPVTLTSRRGTIPVRIVNRSPWALSVSVRLVSPHLRFAQDGLQEARLVAPEQTLVFGVETTTTGRFPVRVQVLTPTGRLMSESTLVIRSTAYNRVALIVTLAAGVVLLALWVRRLLSRRRT